jgi:hypothetical protein
MKTFQNARPGDKVTILVPSGFSMRTGQEFKPKTGKVVITSPDRLVLNMGGRYGIPGVAMADNFVKIRRAA